MENDMLEETHFINEGIKKKRIPALHLQPLKSSANPGSSVKFDLLSQQPSPIKETIDIGFRDLSYSVKEFFHRGRKVILNNLNGEFKSGELTAVMGPSGAGKSTLVDILSGYTTKDVTGKIHINGCIRDDEEFRTRVAYIMQDQHLHPLLSVQEAMNFSINLKLGDHLNHKEKKARVDSILEAIGLNASRSTRTGELSGGQRKRLSVALELVSNPPVMIFDEPTSGLDSSTSTQCMSLLKKLALEGRTIICTIHQPSGLVFEMFDHLYTIAKGQCIYSGTTKSLIRFLDELNLACPMFYNPSDYLLEISTGDYGEQNERLNQKIDDGRNIAYRKIAEIPHTSQINAINTIEKMMLAGIMTPVHAPILPPPLPSTIPPSSTHESKTKSNHTLTSNLCKQKQYSATTIQQFFLLLQRTFLILRRDRSLCISRILIHLCVATFIGIMYFQIGNEAHNIFNVYRYIFFSIMFLMFTAFSGMIMAIPLELPIIIREHFNRWYSLKAYYAAMTFADIPIQLLCTLLYIIITYILTNQPMEFKRFGLFFVICFMLTLVSQSLGLLCGSLFNLKHCAIFGSFFISPFLIFSGFFIQANDAPVYAKWLFHLSFFKYSLEGAAKAIFGYDRPRMVCSEEQIFCKYVIPKKFLKDLNIETETFLYPLSALFITFLIFRISAYYVMLYRLKNKR